ncbi:hypothetical protein OE88DRAFT_711901 [Heliocybe sulcata]|uniref:Mitochondrial protein n=1 Tax=Heliocybe sulcata TaxID=5364 RepID=A0A5C3NFI5_9AGAM|nr:hypothetical protein OE88DRAFT_711901 [Heliocybe sulcata]
MVAHLPPAVKQLLTLRNPHPFPPPSPARLQSVLSRTFNDAKQRRAETGWLVLSTCTLLTANSPPTVGHLYRFATRSDPDNASTRKSLADAVKKAAIMRESALKSTIFVGVPRVILSMTAMQEVMEQDVKDGLRKNSIREANPDNIDQIVARGRALWKSIYAPHDVKLYNKLGALHPDFITFIIQAYGAVLSPLPGGETIEGNLSRAMGSIVGIATLRAESRVVPQLTSHVFGLLKARYEQEGLNEEDKWLASDEGTEWVIRTIDSILDVVEGERAKL